MHDTLERIASGHSVRVSDIGGGYEVRSRLASLGLLPGVTLHIVVRGPLGGPILVELDGTRLAIGRRLARHVVVEP